MRGPLPTPPPPLRLGGQSPTEKVRSKQKLFIDIAYTKTSFDITYKSSTNLKYEVKEDGTREIHGNANKWMNTVRTDIAKQLSALCGLE